MFSDVEEYIRVVETEMYEQSPVVQGNLLKLRTDGERERGVPEFRARRLNTAVLHNPEGLTVLSRD